MTAKLIVVDGKAYGSIEEMPPDIRKKYELAMRLLGDAEREQIPGKFKAEKIFADQGKNGKPDIVENVTTSNLVVQSMKVIVDGKEFDDIESLPPEARARYEQAMGKLDANRNGIPDFIEGMLNTPDQAAKVSTNFGTETPAPSAPRPVDSAITPDTSNGLALTLAGLFILLVCLAGAAALWYLFGRG